MANHTTAPSLAPSSDAHHPWSHPYHTWQVLKGEYGLSADIFSFGIVITEALTAREAQDIIDETRTAAFGLSAAGLRSRFLMKTDERGMPTHRPSACFDLLDLADACCHLEPAARPSVTDCLSRLETIRADFVQADSLTAC